MSSLDLEDLPVLHTAQGRALTPTQRRHLAMGALSGFGRSSVAGEWWQNGFAAARLFAAAAPALPGSLELACGCGDWYWYGQHETPETDRTIPECCLGDRDAWGHWDGECRADLPRACRHLSLDWDRPALLGGVPLNTDPAHWLAILERYFTLPRHPGVLERTVVLWPQAGAPWPVRRLVDATPGTAPRFAGFDQRFVAALEAAVQPDCWEWAATSTKSVARGSRKRPKPVDAPLAIGSRAGQVVCVVMGLAPGGEAWLPREGRPENAQDRDGAAA